MKLRNNNRPPVPRAKTDQNYERTFLGHLLKRLDFYKQEAKCTFDIYFAIMYLQKTSIFTSKASFLFSPFMSFFTMLRKDFKTLAGKRYCAPSGPTSFFRSSCAHPQYIRHLMALSHLFRCFRNCKHSNRLSTNWSPSYLNEKSSKIYDISMYVWYEYMCIWTEALNS